MFYGPADILVKTRPQPPTVIVSFEKNVWDFSNGSSFLPVPRSNILKDYHPILRRIIIHGISCWWKKAFQVMCLFSEIDRVLCFMRKRTRGQGIRGRVRRESHQRRYNLVILRMFEIQAPDYWTFILLAGLVTRPRPLPLPFPIQPFLYFRLEAILEISHTHGSQSSVLLLYFTSQLTPLLSVSWVSFHFWPKLWIMLSLISSITGQVLLTESLTNKQDQL